MGWVTLSSVERRMLSRCWVETGVGLDWCSPFWYVFRAWTCGTFAEFDYTLVVHVYLKL